MSTLAPMWTHYLLVNPGVDIRDAVARGVGSNSLSYADGDEVRTDYRRMLKIVTAAGYRGWVGVEYEGGELPEAEGIKATKRLLETVRAELAG